MTIDRALSGNPFSIDQFRCHLAADNLRTFRPIHKTEPWSDLHARSQFIFKVLFISICQQFNWDFLQNTMADWLLPDVEGKLPMLTQVRSTVLANLLSGYPKPERIRANERARMLRATAIELQQVMVSAEFKKFFARPQLGGENGFYHLMKKISAFAADGLEKKVRVLAHDLYREDILKFGDPENLRPAVEYHILRLYIRSGRVYPTNDDIRKHLTGNDESRPRLVTLLRKAVEEAMNLTAFYAGMDVATLNYVEWQIGRTVCVPDTTPYCTTPPLEPMPQDVVDLSPNRCVYAAFCRSFTEPQYGWYHEPRFQKAIY